MMKRIYLGILLICMILSGCGERKPSGKLTNDTLLTIQDFPTEDLPKPNDTIASLDDFIRVLDYMAFYRIGDKVYFQIDDVYAEKFVNPYTEFQKAYQQSDLADVYACILDDDRYTKEHIIGIKYSMSKDIASQTSSENPQIPILHSFDDIQGNKNDEPIPLERSHKQEIECENSEQLYFLVMNGYRPKPRKGSVAERIYQLAKDVIHQRIVTTMSDFEKIKAIYDYLTGEIRYDYATAYSRDTYLVKEQAYYLEGVFLNRLAVCDGKAKAYALLLNMIDIPCVRETGTNDNSGDHAWNMVRLDGKWYVSCTTYGQSNLKDSIGRIVPNYAMLLTSKDTSFHTKWGYMTQKHLEIYEKLETEGYDVYQQMSKNVNINLQIASIDELIDLIKKVGYTPETKVEFQYVGDQPENFQKEMVDYLKTVDNTNVIQIHTEGEIVYSILYVNQDE